MSNYEMQCQEDARLAILAELARQRDGTLNDLSLSRTMDLLGLRRSREWVRTQLGWLDGMGAVNLRHTELAGVGKVAIVELTRTGRDHVERRNLLDGVSRPADQD